MKTKQITNLCTHIDNLYNTSINIYSHTFYSTVNPQVSSTAWLSLSNNFCLLSYFGKSRRLKHVCALGKLSVGTSVRWIVNKRGPAAPVDPKK